MSQTKMNRTGVSLSNDGLSTAICQTLARSIGVISYVLTNSQWTN